MGRNQINTFSRLKSVTLLQILCLFTAINFDYHVGKLFTRMLLHRIPLLKSIAAWICLSQRNWRYTTRFPRIVFGEMSLAQKYPKHSWAYIHLFLRLHAFCILDTFHCNYTQFSRKKMNLKFNVCDTTLRLKL